MAEVMEEWILDRGRPAIGWRLGEAEVVAEPSVALAGSPVATAAFTVAEAIGRRRCRRALGGHVVARWRPLGALWVVTTNLRLMVLVDGRWSSVWLGSVSEVEATDEGVILRFADEPDYRLAWA